MPSSAAQLTSFSLESLPIGAKLGRILSAALQAVDPAAAVRNHLSRHGTLLISDDVKYDLRDFNCIYIVAIGKAGVPMASAAGAVLGNHLTRGLALVKYGHAFSAYTHPNIKILEAGHPYSDANSIAGTQQILALLSNLQKSDLVICLISGGGSALFSAPAPGITLQDMHALMRLLFVCGARIDEINTLRKHIDTVKGGGLTRWISPAAALTLILSDVVGDSLDTIASGPTSPDPTTFLQAWEILHKYNLIEQTAPAIIEHIRRGIAGQIPETPKPSASLFQNTHHVLVGSNRRAAEAAIRQANAEGFNTLLQTTTQQGEANKIGAQMATIANHIRTTGQPISPPACIIAGGETTVTIRGNGLGGRNQECALGAAMTLAGQKNVVFISLASDGGDGPTDAAGAVATGETIDRARQLGLDPVDYLDRNDSYHFFEPLEDLIKTGPTMTNVNDLMALVVY